ncbi:MAG: alpha-E domain-containing protein [Acidimicrobiia bacterium]|nr:alpha-E domain-containing protein [Acidimicrobiia bacterium]
MLSRHAEGLFWIGRYVERASDITRMLDVAYDVQMERPPSAREAVWRDLLDVLYINDQFVDHHDTATTETINRFLVLDGDNPVSVASSIVSARTNIMNVRDVVPIELLESINRLHTLFASGELGAELETNTHAGYHMVATHCRTISGAMFDSMARTDGYRFMMLGRYLERAEMTCRTIEVTRSVAPTDDAAWRAVLRSVSGLHAFTRLHGALAEVDEVVRFLLMDRDFPYSVLHCLSECASQLSTVSTTGTWQSPRMVGRVKAEIEFSDVPSVETSALAELVARLEVGIRDASQAFHDDLYQFGGDATLHSFEAL